MDVPRPGHIWARLWRLNGANIGLGPPDSRLGGGGAGMNALAVVSDVDDRGPRVFARFGRGDGDRAFRAAVRHSRLVRILRVAVPGAVVFAVVGGLAFSFLLKPLSMLSKLPVDV